MVEDAKWYSAQASTNVRYLAVAGFAVVWALAGQNAKNLRAWTLSVALVLLALALLADFAHYTAMTDKLSAVLERARSLRLAADAPAPLTPEDTPAHKWFRHKRTILKAAYVVLLIAFVAHVYPEVWETLTKIARR